MDLEICKSSLFVLQLCGKKEKPFFKKSQKSHLPKRVNPRYNKSKKSHFFKGVNPCFWPKNAKISLETMLSDFAGKKNPP